jgi:hypothetical protein
LTPLLAERMRHTDEEISLSSTQVWNVLKR